MKKITFMSDRVIVKTGRIDNSAQVLFSIGEYELNNIKDLVSIIDKNMRVTVEVKDR